MGVAGAATSAGRTEGPMERNKKRGLNATLVVFFSLVLFVGMTRIHAMVAGCDADEATMTGEFEHEVGSRRMLSASELTAEAGRRVLLEAAEARRVLASSRSGYFISYNSLSASRTYCPPRSGRSYYTRNCNSASGPVRPYSRGCSSISRCARESS